MRDTLPELDAKYRAMLLERSGEERLKMAGSMYAAARAFVVASVLEADPTASPAALRQALFLRFYGHEFDEPTRGRILARLRAEVEREGPSKAALRTRASASAARAGGPGPGAGPRRSRE